MARRRFVWREGRLVEVDLHAPLPERKGPYIMSDLTPYRNVVNGGVISSRSSHRAFLRDNQLVEVGNETPAPRHHELESPRQAIVENMHRLGML
ncbi:hypothetical protein Mmc1_1691 [Magnetococcus marinus MC-1]|uniref:Uncharacterized protein n=1 Tax=Magnetococcus marinus (strain ATCC BAA-1437 / JCM 17883 / MC-1) TaxID=156889 RepID=A0L8A7_MAGMM|nr:hypothetical protein [Magnetococcus marinus]ABK44200.1 hypothetical protein Mmc1_1691 [Magnetococcus marinus MC-1]